jgi:hypothetical protein
MVKKIKDIDGSMQRPVLEHDQLLQHMRHGAERCQQHKYRHCDQYGIRNAVNQFPHAILPDSVCRFSPNGAGSPDIEADQMIEYFLLNIEYLWNAVIFEGQSVAIH